MARKVQGTPILSSLFVVVMLFLTILIERTLVHGLTHEAMNTVGSLKPWMVGFWISVPRFLLLLSVGALMAVNARVGRKYALVYLILICVYYLHFHWGVGYMDGSLESYLYAYCPYAVVPLGWSLGYVGVLAARR